MCRWLCFQVRIVLVSVRKRACRLFDLHLCFKETLRATRMIWDTCCVQLVPLVATSGNARFRN